MFKKFLVPLLSLLIIAGGTFLAIKFAKGYRPNLSSVSIQGTGLLVANSFPDGAQVFINGKLTTATDDTLNLPPGEYQIEIKKDGFTTWKKTLTLKEELVSQTNATLFPSVSGLKPLTFIGALNPVPSPDGQKIAYVVKNSANPTKDGLWILEMTNGSFIREKQPRQLSRNQPNLDQAQLTWSPDSSQIVVSLTNANYLLDSSRFNDQEDVRDVTAQLPVIFSEWEQELHRRDLQRLLTLPKEMQQIATSSATNLYFSPDEQKLLFTATQATSIPPGLVPPLPSESTQAEQRSLQPGATYIYDLKEDKNFRVLDPSPAELGETIKRKLALVSQIKDIPFIGRESSPSAHLILQTNLQTDETIAAFNAQYSPLPVQSIQWFPTSNHLILTQPDKITILEYDGTNHAVILANSFEDNFVYPWPNGSQLVILTNLNQTSDLPANLYSINLK